jgi:hypothetical protein
VFDLTAAGLGKSGPIIRGRVEFRRPNPSDPTRSEFSPPVTFQYDTGANSSVVSESFAVAHGFGDFRQTGTPVGVRWFNAAAPPLPAWRVYRWVRFRDYQNGVTPFPRRDAGGIAHLEFRVAFLVIPGVVLTLPLLGLWDMHHFFSVASSDHEYTFYPHSSRTGSHPAATDGGQGVREIV